MIRKQEGQSMVETALVLPVLLLLLAGMFDLGRVLYSAAHLHLATQEAVRLGGLGETDSEIVEFTKDYVNFVDPSKLEVIISPTEDNRESGEYVNVLIKYPIDLMTPIISQIMPDPIVITADSTIRVE